jgi:Tol biopolymer transport system component
MTISRLNRRRALAALVAAVVAGGCSNGPTATATLPVPLWPKILPTATASPVAGKLLTVHDGNFHVFDLATRKETPLTHFPQRVFPTAPAISPDGKRIAFSYYAVPTTQGDLGGSDLYVMDLNGENQKVVRPHPAPDTGYLEPSWTVAGNALVVTFRNATRDSQGNYAGQTTQIVRVGLEGGEPISLAVGGQTPVASPDGKHLAYLIADQTGYAHGIWIGDADGKGARDVLGNRGFTWVREPRFSPDSQRIAFAAVGGPSGTPTPKSASAWPSLAAVAEAHGIPWDIWTVRPDGTELRRLTHVGEDSPTPAWSPDGKWIAMAGEIGLYVLDAEGQTLARISTLVSGGGIAWLE